MPYHALIHPVIKITVCQGWKNISGNKSGLVSYKTCDVISRRAAHKSINATFLLLPAKRFALHHSDAAFIRRLNINRFGLLAGCVTSWEDVKI